MVPDTCARPIRSQSQLSIRHFTPIYSKLSGKKVISEIIKSKSLSILTICITNYLQIFNEHSKLYMLWIQRRQAVIWLQWNTICVWPCVQTCREKLWLLKRQRADTLGTVHATTIRSKLQAPGDQMNSNESYTSVTSSFLFLPPLFWSVSSPTKTYRIARPVPLPLPLPLLDTQMLSRPDLQLSGDGFVAQADIKNGSPLNHW